VFLKRLNDYILFPKHALRGVIVRADGAELALEVTRDFLQFLQTQNDRSYRAESGGFLLPGTDLKPEDHLLWPISKEERLFEAVATTAAGYALSVTRKTVVLDAQAQRFIGFQRVEGGMEFRDGDDFVRFAAGRIECGENGRTVSWALEDVLVGWALDGEGRVCAICREASGFEPLPEGKLVRFLTEKEAEGIMLTRLG
jgi:hypothetical protein